MTGVTSGDCHSVTVIKRRIPVFLLVKGQPVETYGISDLRLYLSHDDDVLVLSCREFTTHGLIRFFPGIFVIE